MEEKDSVHIIELDAIDTEPDSWFGVAKKTRRKLTPDEIALAKEMGIDPDVPRAKDGTPKGIETIEGGIDKWTGPAALALDESRVQH